MTELLITLMNSPRKLQRLVALAILVMVLMIGWVSIYSLASVITTKRTHIEELRTELFQLDHIITRRPLDDVSQPAAQLAGPFVEGSSVPAVQAALQERLTSFATESGVTIASMSGTAPIQINGVTYVGLRADFDGGLKSVHQAIQALETSLPPLVIRSGSIRGTNSYAGGEVREPIQLSAQVSVYGAVSPDVSTAIQAKAP
ncbi:MAG: hypothetical protein EON58_02670 [Alphaproteobacteria bacterium]|nr:MAG: hypothetical protein EON58_02670 [Alphaproteobacteria bacterium]